jgi:nucleoid-associated protein YgaU
MLIYEAHKEAIGDNPSLLQVGQVLQIPKLPTD